MSLTIDAIARDSSSPKNGLIISLFVSDQHAVITPGKNTEQQDRIPQILNINNDQRSNPVINPVYGLERETSSPKNALVVSLMGSDQTYLNPTTLSVDSVPMVTMMHARSDVQGNAKSDQKQRGGMS